MKPGEKVTAEEVERIEALSPDEKEQEIIATVKASGRSGHDAEVMATWLRLFYRRPDLYQRVPGTEHDTHLNPAPLPYEGE